MALRVIDHRAGHLTRFDSNDTFIEIFGFRQLFETSQNQHLFRPVIGMIFVDHILIVV